MIQDEDSSIDMTMLDRFELQNIPLWKAGAYCTCTIHWLLGKFKNLFEIMHLYPISWYTLQYYENAHLP